MEELEPVVVSSLFSDVNLEDISNSDPLKQLSALQRIIFEQCNGIECIQHFERIQKYCLAPGNIHNKDVRSMAYNIIKNMNLTDDDWSKLIPALVGDLNGPDIDIKISAIKVVECLPAWAVVELLESGSVDLLAFGRLMTKNPAEESAYSHLRAVSLQTIGSLLLYRDTLTDHLRSFNLAAWSLITERVLIDPSKKVFKVALEAICTLFSDVYRDGQHRQSEASMPFPSHNTYRNDRKFGQRVGATNSHGHGSRTNSSLNRDNSASGSEVKSNGGGGGGNTNNSGKKYGDYSWNDLMQQQESTRRYLRMPNDTGEHSTSKNIVFGGIGGFGGLKKRYGGVSSSNPTTTSDVSGSLTGPSNTPNTNMIGTLQLNSDTASANFMASVTQMHNILSSLDRYAHIVLIKLTTHIYALLNRFKWIDHLDLPPAIMMLSVLLEQLDTDANNIQVHFMTSPRHLTSEIVQTFFFPLLHDKDDAIVFEAASNLLYLTSRDPTENPGWVLAACRALLGLVSRDSSRPVIKKIMPVLISSLTMISPGVLLPVLVLTLQHIEKLALPLSQRVSFFYQLIDIPLQLATKGDLDPLGFFSNLLRHPWIYEMLCITDGEHTFREELIGTIIKSLLNYWRKLTDVQQTQQVQQSRTNVSERPTSPRSTPNNSARGSGPNSSPHVSLRTNSRASLNSGGGGGGSIPNSPTTNRNHPNNFSDQGSHPGSNNVGADIEMSSSTGSSQFVGPTLAQRKYTKIWREVLYYVSMELVRILTWKTHVRTYCYQLFLQLVDTVCSSFAFVRPRPVIRELLARVLEPAGQLKSDSVCLRWYYTIMKHSFPKSMSKVVYSLFKATQTRFLGWLDTPQTNVADRTLGYRIDQVCKTTLSSTDLEVLVLLLHMFSTHPLFNAPNSALSPSSDSQNSTGPIKYTGEHLEESDYAESLDTSLTSSITTSGVGVSKPRVKVDIKKLNFGSTEQGASKLNAIRQYIQLIKQFKSEDLVTASRYAWISDLPCSHNTFSLISLNSMTARESSILSPMSYGSSSARSSYGTPGKGDGQGNSFIVTEGSLGATSSLSTSHYPTTYFPPVEFLTREVADKHPDDEFNLHFSKACLPSLSYFDQSRRNKTPIVISSPSDPFSVQAYHITTTESSRVTFFVKVTNLTTFHIPRVLLCIDTKGRIEPFNARTKNQTILSNMDPGESAFFQTAFKLNYLHSNELYVRLVLFPSLYSSVAPRSTLSSSSTSVSSKDQTSSITHSTSINGPAASSSATSGGVSPGMNEGHKSLSASTSISISTGSGGQSTTTSTSTSTSLHPLVSISSVTGSSTAFVGGQAPQEIGCIPYSINMHTMILPWIISHGDYMREWSRYAHTLTFRAILDLSITPAKLDEELGRVFHRAVQWKYHDSFQFNYSGITWWDERIVISVAGTRGDASQAVPVEGDAFHIRFEVRTSTLNLLVVLDHNRQQWLRDLTPSFPTCLTIVPDTGLPTLSSMLHPSSPSSFSGISSSLRTLDEKLLLNRWLKAK